MKPPVNRERYKRYQQGMNDAEIAEIEGVQSSAVFQWRQRYGLPTNRRTGTYVRTDALLNMVFYQLGWSDTRIARHRGIRKTSVAKWRNRRQLPANFRYTNERYDPAPGPEAIVARVRRAVGNKLAPDIVDDAVASMFEAIMSGTLALGEIEREARRYGNRVLDRYASRFGPRSLDEELGDDGEGFRMIDLIRDDRSSSWLEEMGATVW